MHIVNVTDIRRNIREILMEVIRTKEPAVILQRSKPVAYLVDAETFEKTRKLNEMDLLTQTRKESLDRILQLRVKMAKKGGVRGDSVQLIRELREGLNRHE
ncbi:prevent-host-death family protein [Desulfofundulus australicus DSM 11792]|jgi:prevent-host-death family protein|uniref:Antitoxin n=1 Tax=Desulfofundulus australicus DSM 11792 TaxID=1121425 RepID=A0A1M4TMG9_9FIRM|nr:MULTISPECIES: type II toxin-antitoxin system Phd/YefM family antitoxin [Desulfofundulus]SHE45628.1 prevent-host-death family protein [Desulfofundulus australicus DSM 11792]